MATPSFRGQTLPVLQEASVDLSRPFQREGTGFVTSPLTRSENCSAYVAVHNRKHGVLAGHSFGRSLFPWIALWEENRARKYLPGMASPVRWEWSWRQPDAFGGNQGRASRTLFDVPVLTNLGPHSRRPTPYYTFMTRVPSQWEGVSEVAHSRDGLGINGIGGRGPTQAAKFGLSGVVVRR